MGPRPLEGTWHGVVSAALFARCSLRRASPLRRERDELRHLRLRASAAPTTSRAVLSALSPAGDRASINNGWIRCVCSDTDRCLFASDRLRPPPLFRFLLESLQRAETLGIYLLSFFTYIFARIRQQ